MDGDADRPALVGDRPGDRLADPPGGVGGELVAAAVVELLDGADEAHRPLLDEIQEGQPATEIGLGDRDDQTQVGLDHLLLGEHVAALDAPRQHHLLLSGQEADPPDGAEVEAQRIEAGLDRQVDLDLLALIGISVGVALGRGLDAVALGLRGAPVGADDDDALFIQVRVEFLDLLLGHIHLFEAGLDLGEGEKPTLLAARDQRPQLVELHNRSLVAQQNDFVNAHSP